MSRRWNPTTAPLLVRSFAWTLGLPGCGGDPGPGEAVRIPATAIIPVTTRGALELPDGTQGTIPPGALAADTTVTISRPEPRVFSPEGWLASVRLEPEGTVFSTPVEVTIPDDASKLELPKDVAPVPTSLANDPVDLGSEASRTALVADVDRAPGRFPGRIGHFSRLDGVWVPQRLVSPVIPGRDLRSRDLIDTLAGANNDFRRSSMAPLQVGMFHGNAIRIGVIESTTPTGFCDPPADGVVDHQGSTGECAFVCLRGQHVSAGARRPRGASPERGAKAVEAARKWLGTPYGATGLGIAEIGSGVDCVQRAELAWKEAGVWITCTRRLVLTPYAQYSNGVPVTDIEVRLSEERCASRSWSRYACPTSSSLA